MEHLSNELLIHAYRKALAMRLADDFIVLLEEELARRGLLNRDNHTDEMK